MVSDREVEEQLEAFGRTLQHQSGEPLHGGNVGATPVSQVDAFHRNGARRRTPYLVAAAALVAVAGVGFWAASRTGPDRIVPAGPTLTTGTLTESDSSSPPTTSATQSASAVPEPSTAPTTVVAAEGLASNQCGDPSAPEQAAVALYDKIVIARSTDDLTILDGCINAVPDVFSGTEPNCWTQCGTATQEFLFDTFRVYESTGLDGTIDYFVNSVVSYVDPDGERLDVVESWTLTPTQGGLTVDDFGVVESMVDRYTSAQTIAEYFGYIETENWELAALMLDNGAQDPQQRLDLNVLDPQSFSTQDIAAALADWCALGCNTEPPSPNDLTLDRSYGIDRNGQRVEATWFEGDYSIGGLPIRSVSALASGFDSEAILADGTVTEAEFQTMFAFLIECALTNGSPGPIDLPEFDFLEQRFAYSISGENFPAFDACNDDHGQSIDRLFQLDPTRAEQRDQNYTAVAICLDTANYDYNLYAQQAIDEQPGFIPDLVDLSIDEIIKIGQGLAVLDNPDNEIVLRICLHTQQGPPTNTSRPILDVATTEAVSGDELGQLLPRLEFDVSQLPYRELDISFADGVTVVIEGPDDITPRGADLCAVIAANSELSRVCATASDLGGVLLFSYDDPVEDRAYLYVVTSQKVEVAMPDVCNEVRTAESLTAGLRVVACASSADASTVEVGFTSGDQRFTTEMALNYFEPSEFANPASETE